MSNEIIVFASFSHAFVFSVCMYFFCLLLLVNLVSASITFFPESVSKLAADLEAEVPGSVQWLYEWAVAEELLGKMGDLFDGKSRLVQNASPKFATAVSFFIMSTNPEMTFVEFVTHFRRIIPDVQYASVEFVSSSYYQGLTPLRVPDWFYQHLLVSRATGLKKDEIYASANTLAQTMRDGGAIKTDDPLFTPNERKVRGLAHLWLRFGFASPADQEAPVSLDINTMEWVMKPDIQKEALRYMTLVFLSS